MKSSFRWSIGRGSLAAALGAVVALSYVAPAQAATDERDQFQTLVFNQQKLLPRFAETFTVGKAGQLDRVTLASTATSSTFIQVSIHTVNPTTGQPTDTTLGTPVNVFGPWSCCAAFKSVAFDPIPVTVGQQLAIVVDAFSGTFAWKNGDNIDAYGGGHAFVGNPWVAGTTLRFEDFAFETWVITDTTPPNQPPVVSATNATVTVKAGVAPTNTGTFSDPDGDTVSLSASAGTVSKTGVSTWSWTEPASADASTQTITITANDGQGHSTPTSFTVTVLPNGAPSVAADTAAVSVNEGTAPTNTGTFSDPDGDPVALSASAGTVTKTGAGTWSWSQPASDEASMATVTISGNDGHGHTATATFTVTVNAVAPVARIVTDPPFIPEGSPESFTGAATTAFAGDAGTLTYTWRVTKNGNAYASGLGTTFTFTPDDDGTYVVTFRATDDGGLYGTDSMTIIGTNVAPAAHITGATPSTPLVVTSEESLTFTGNFSDPGVLDTHSVTWNFGDGTSSAAAHYGPGGSASFSTTHAYPSAGTYNVRLVVVDNDGGVGTANYSLTVQTTQQALTAISNEVARLTDLNDGQRNSLNAKLRAAAAAAARGDRRACNNELNAFLNELDSYVKTGKVSSGEAAKLQGAVYAVKGSLGTYNRFLEWWPLAI